MAVGCRHATVYMQGLRDNLRSCSLTFTLFEMEFLMQVTDPWASGGRPVFISSTVLQTHVAFCLF